MAQITVRLKREFQKYALIDLNKTLAKIFISADMKMSVTGFRIIMNICFCLLSMLPVKPKNAAIDALQPILFYFHSVQLQYSRNLVVITVTCRLTIKSMKLVIKSNFGRHIGSKLKTLCLLHILCN